MGHAIRQLNVDDYDKTLVPWWNQWGWTPPQRDFLPDNGVGGLIVFDDVSHEPVCAGYLYLTNSEVVWIDWVVSNKSYTDREKRKKALDLLLSTLVASAKEKGYRFAYALIKNDSLIRTYEKHGFIKGDSYNLEMIKVL
jgi:GNAT superfamily N-acetyltransferase